MKRNYLSLFAAMLLATALSITAYAGDINAAEQKILDVISATYQYGDGYYRVTDAYIKKVTEYLSRDNIDMTEKEVNDYISQFYDNIGMGISAGYMVRVGDVKAPSKPRPSDNNKALPSEEDSEDENPGGITSATDGEEWTDDVPAGESGADSKESSDEEAHPIIIIEEAEEDNTLGTRASGEVEYTVSPMDGVMYVWNTDSLEVHAKAYIDSEIIGTLKKGDRVVITGAASTGWAQIDYNGKSAYVSSFYLRTGGYVNSQDIENETEQNKEELSKETEAENPVVKKEKQTDSTEKDYSGARPLAKKINVGLIAAVAAMLIGIIAAAVVLIHKKKTR